MPLRTPKRGYTIVYRRPNGKTATARVLARQEAAPPTPGISNAATGGTLAAATYSYRLSAIIGGIETAPSVAATTTTSGTTSTATVDWTAISTTAPYKSATAFNVYGRVGGSELLMATVNMPTTTYIDTGAATPSGALPTATGSVRLKLIQVKQVVTAVKSTAVKQVNSYFAR